jgi:hypothetical protein
VEVNMSGTKKPVQRPRRSRGKTCPVATVHTCIECPAYGAETCKTLQQLGMYCETAVAATDTFRTGFAGSRKSAVA